MPMKMFSKKHAFERIPTTDEDEAFDQELASKTASATQGRSRRRTFIQSAAALVALFTVVIGGLALTAVLSGARDHSAKPKWTSCGDSPTTARSRGCSFDLISFAWQTPECFDGDLVSEFASWEGNWTFFADDKFTQPVDQEIAFRGERTPLFVQWDYHIVHCTFMWRQMHRAYEKGWIDEHLGNYHHTMHCQKMILMDDKEAEKAVTVARVIYPECQGVH